MTPNKQRNPIARWLAIIVLVGAGILVLWANGQDNRTPSRVEEDVTAVVDHLLDNFEVSASNDAVTVSYLVRGLVKPAPGNEAARNLNVLLLGTICNLKQVDAIGNRILYFDVSYRSDVILRFSVNPDTLRGFDCDTIWMVRTNLARVATSYQWSEDR